MATLSSLPPEIYLEVVSYLSKRAQVKLAATCKTFYHMTLHRIYEEIELLDEDHIDITSREGECTIKVRDGHNENEFAAPAYLRSVQERPELANHTKSMVLNGNVIRTMRVYFKCKRTRPLFTRLEQISFEMKKVYPHDIMETLRLMPRIQHLRFVLTRDRDVQHELAQSARVMAGYADVGLCEKLKSLCITSDVAFNPYCRKGYDDSESESETGSESDAESENNEESWTCALWAGFRSLIDMTNLESLSITWSLLHGVFQLAASHASLDSTSQKESNRRCGKILDFIPSTLQRLSLTFSQLHESDSRECLSAFIGDFTDSVQNQEQPQSLKEISILYFDEEIFDEAQEYKLVELLTVCARQKIEVKRILWEYATCIRLNTNLPEEQWISGSRALRILARFPRSRDQKGKVEIGGLVDPIIADDWVQLLNMWP